MNPHSQYTLKVWFFDMGYLYALVIALVVVGSAIRSLDPKAASVSGAILDQDYEVAGVEPR